MGKKNPFNAAVGVYKINCQKILNA